MKTFAMLDEGSELTIIDQEIVDKLGLQGQWNRSNLRLQMALVRRIPIVSVSPSRGLYGANFQDEQCTNLEEPAFTSLYNEHFKTPTAPFGLAILTECQDPVTRVEQFVQLPQGPWTKRGPKKTFCFSLFLLRKINSNIALKGKVPLSMKYFLQERGKNKTNVSIEIVVIISTQSLLFFKPTNLDKNLNAR